jgi:hypothetical protein
MRDHNQFTLDSVMAHEGICDCYGGRLLGCRLAMSKLMQHGIVSRRSNIHKTHNFSKK